MSFLIFQKRLSKSDVKYRLAIPSAALQHLPPFPERSKRVILTVTVGSDCSVREFHCVRSLGYYPKPTMDTGWRQIVKEKKLRQGDLIMFYKEGNPWLYRIEVRRTIRLVGQEVYYSV